MGAKLENGSYTDRRAFEADFRLMIQNCQTYNIQGSYASNESMVLDIFFEKREYFIYGVERRAANE